MKVKVCTGTKCMFYGADNIIDRLIDLQDNLTDYPGIPADAELKVELIPCDGSCKGKDTKIAPLVYVAEERMERASSPEVMEKILNRLQANDAQ